MAIIRVYTKQIIKEEYDFGLAASVHFCMAWGDSPAVELNQGCGILFPEGIIKEDNTIDARGISDPIVSRDKESFYIAGKYVNDSIEETAPGKLYVWETKDFLRFQDQGLKECSTLPLESAGSQVEIPDSMVKDILDQWTPVKAVSVEIPYNNADIADSSVCTDTVNIHYSDGSICTKPVIWTETEEPEHYAGKIQSPAYPYPLLKGFADPVFFKHEGKWYFLATNDLNGNIGLFLREADTIMGLFEEGHSCSVILDYSKEHQFIQTFWAPEWHMIGGVPYILFAVGGEKWAPQSHVMKYKGSGSIMDSGSWELPVRVRQKNGHFLTEDGITLDMIYFKAGGTSYVVWSERYHIGSPLDSGSMLYIATIDEKDPTILTSEKVLLSRPLYGWENVAGTINNEGPYALLRRGQVYLSYSGGAAVGHT
ncbi:MAG: family 43 glycosylhydrolase, partial [Clostridiales bacterium]|nr:family 43 glycosylhydrolase [Candidatus Blautia equi]